MMTRTGGGVQPTAVEITYDDGSVRVFSGITRYRLETDRTSFTVEFEAVGIASVEVES